MPNWRAAFSCGTGSATEPRLSVTEEPRSAPEAQAGCQASSEIAESTGQSEPDSVAPVLPALSAGPGWPPDLGKRRATDALTGTRPGPMRDDYAEVIATLVRPAAVIGMVKANGYGHGIAIAARGNRLGGQRRRRRLRGCYSVTLAGLGDRAVARRQDVRVALPRLRQTSRGPRSRCRRRIWPCRRMPQARHHLIRGLRSVPLGATAIPLVGDR